MGKRKLTGKGKEKKRKRQGKAEGEGKWDGEGEGKGEGEGEGKGKEKRKGRWEKDSLRKVGRTDARTDARTLRCFYTNTLSNAMHCVGQTIKCVSTGIATVILTQIRSSLQGSCCRSSNF